MGHLMFAGIFVFFLIVLISKIYFSYLYASKKRMDDNVEIPVEAGESGKRFYVQKGIKVIASMLIFIGPFFFIYLFNLLKEKPQDSDVLWFLIDLSILAYFIFIILFIEGVRSYVHIHDEGFEYRQTFRTKSYSRKEIEYVCRYSDFIFIKRKDRRMPVILGTVYANSDCLYRMLYSLQNN